MNDTITTDQDQLSKLAHRFTSEVDLNDTMLEAKFSPVSLNDFMINFYNYVKLWEDAKSPTVQEPLHCFQCEIEMPVKFDKKGQPRCSNCGFKH